MLTDEMKAAGWIEHDGGPCPVPLLRRVWFMLGSGRKSKTATTAGGLRWSQDDPPHPYDIIAYKPENSRGTD